MVKLIEDQIHDALIEREKQRCKELEKKLKRPVKPRNIEKPWTRQNKVSLCQENELLELVQDYDYDLNNKNFQKYCEERGILHIAGEKDSKRWEFFVNYKKTKDEYFKDPYFQYAEEYNGKSYKYSKDEMEAGWKIIELGRAKLQDCWEIFKSN